MSFMFTALHMGNLLSAVEQGALLLIGRCVRKLEQDLSLKGTEKVRSGKTVTFHGSQG